MFEIEEIPMKKLLLLALAPLAMAANPASAQPTMQRTVTTPSHTSTTTRTVTRATPVVQHTTVTRTRTTTIHHPRTHAVRRCHWTMRHHHRTRVCTTVRRRY
jgi:hypothetical protein